MAKPAPRRYSRAEFHIPVVLNSAAAQRVVGRSLKRVSRALYTIDVVLHAIGDSDEVDQVEDLIDTMLGGVGDLYARDLTKLERRFTEAAIPHQVVYSAPIQLTFRISSPQLAQYARLVETLDRIAALADTLRLGGALRNRLALNIVYHNRNRLLDLGIRIAKLETSARAAALGKGRADALADAELRADGVLQVEGDLPEDDAEVADALSALEAQPLAPEAPPESLADAAVGAAGDADAERGADEAEPEADDAASAPEAGEAPAASRRRTWRSMAG